MEHNTEKAQSLILQAYTIMIDVQEQHAKLSERTKLAQSMLDEARTLLGAEIDQTMLSLLDSLRKDASEQN